TALRTTTATAISRSRTDTVDPSERSRMNRNDRAIRIDSVLNRSPMRSVGITYIDTDIEKTKATPAMMPGMVRGSITGTNRGSGPDPGVAAGARGRGAMHVGTR